MKLVGGFEEDLSRCVRLLRAIANLRADLAFEHISDGDARMAVRAGTFARPIGHFNHRGSPPLGGQLREVALKNDLASTRLSFRDLN